MKRPQFAVGTRVLAVKNVGPVSDGQEGIVTAVHEVQFLWRKRPIYLCTFLGNVKVAMKPSEIDDYDHGRTLQELEIEFDGLSVNEQLQHIMGQRP
jgi:hypothetical protein